MTINELVVSLETAQKLKAEGWTEQTAFYWFFIGGEWKLITDESARAKVAYKWCYAHTAEEVLAQLPKSIYISGGGNAPLEVLVGNIYQISYNPRPQPYPHGNCFFPQIHYSLSEAAAQMWLWCRKHGYIEVKK